MVKLTAEIIQSSYQYINPIRERELDLRGKMPAFCNLKSGGIPVRRRLSSLLLWERLVIVGCTLQLVHNVGSSCLKWQDFFKLCEALNLGCGRLLFGERWIVDDSRLHVCFV